MIKLACMTLPYANVSLERALVGIAGAGYLYVAFGLPHAGEEVLDEQDPQAVSKLKRLFERYKLEPVMLIGTEQLAPGQPIERTQLRLEAAQALGIKEVLSLGTWGYREFPDIPIPEAEMVETNKRFIEKFRRVGSIAESLGITVTIKPHTGNTATARHIRQTLDEIGCEFIKASYDPGNVRFYEGIDPAADFPLIADRTVSIIAKDHSGIRAEHNFPLPGEGEVEFRALFRSWKGAGSADGTIVVERVDGTGGPMTTEQIDLRLAQARTNLEGLLHKSGL
ncbi:sugar phosphate isomerase/epimerase family protein [Paenibacillus mendelii]|uniref:Sugar phosphate isomerase/epimerase family protein n=1 Tax=Paenibacillus mendelii TaxID=206163 RepID=A0ABV6JNX8_9BACL|nr:sugar phosphate isomerase/epimerase [Paenibacillus mendelii]MCQ6560645.1 sugar phosphate isomerase/epimerase [Paenibacillus mendelii]